MSKDNVKKLFEKIQKDAELQKKYAKLMQAHQTEAEKALAEKLIELGKNGGFTFSKEDLLAARAELMDKNNGGKELSENDLENVAGGFKANTRKGLAIGFSIATAGIACGVASIVVESVKGAGECGRESTTVNCGD